MEVAVAVMQFAVYMPKYNICNKKHASIVSF